MSKSEEDARYEIWSADRVEFDPRNANEGTERGQAALEAPLQKNGAGRSIVLDRKGRIIAGNKTFQNWRELGYDEIAIVRQKGNVLVAVLREDLDLVDDPDGRARSLAYADNRVAELDLAWNVDEILADYDAGVDLGYLWMPGEIDDMVQLSLPGIAEDGNAAPRIDEAEELREKWGTELGQIWVLPSRVAGREHRIICGDCTKRDDVNALIDIPVRLMVTDPPYGVEYDQEWRSQNRTGKVNNDDRADWREAWELAVEAGVEVAYVWHASRYASTVQDSLAAVGFEQRAQIIWAKPVLVFSQGHYHWQHEPCFYVVKKGATAQWIGDRKQTTLWEMSLDEDVPGGHSTQKPLEAMQRPIINHAGDVYEPFSGSGTTIIAAENQGRQCRALEIDPAYVAIALQRYLDAFGIEPYQAAE